MLKKVKLCDCGTLFKPNKYVQPLLDSMNLSPTLSYLHYFQCETMILYLEKPWFQHVRMGRFILFQFA